MEKNDNLYLISDGCISQEMPEYVNQDPWEVFEWWKYEPYYDLIQTQRIEDICNNLMYH